MSQTQSKSALRRKNFEGICRRCEQTRPLRLAEYDKDRKVLTLKCKKCGDLTTYPLKRALKSGRVLTEKQFEERKKALAICEDYSPQKTYWVGQEIRHTTFQDTGTVLKKTKSDGGHKLVVVKFEKSGKKTLIEGIEA